jgi:flagellar basal-body rod protein FlgC
MSPVWSIATSGMAAATRRLEVSARNVANALSAGPLKSADATVRASFSAYVPLRVDQVEIAGGGTAANVSPVSPSQVPAYDPEAPYADANGMVASPNVDLADEMIQQMVARYTFAMNARVLRTDADMTKSLLDIMA